jgi:hypothetical protein
MSKALQSFHFSESYKEARFLEWCRLGRPTANEYYLKLSPTDAGRRPSQRMLELWMRGWKVRAAEMDAEVEAGIIKENVAEKVEMLERHAKDAKEMQGIALDYLRQHQTELTPNSAVKLLQLSVDIERESVGIPTALRKMSKLDDESLIDEITAIIQDSSIDIESLDIENEDL